MGWESRNGKGRYYVQKARHGARVVSRYIGMGQYAELLSDAQEGRAESTLGMARESRQDRAECPIAREREQRLNAYCEDVRAFFRQEMESAGWYQHRRQWRRGRGGGMALTATENKRVELFRQAKTGDEKAAAELVAFWEQEGTKEIALNGIYAVYFGYTDARAGKNIPLEMAIRQKTDQLRKDLTAEDDTPLERLLIERVIVCYHAMNDAERIFQGKQDGATFTQHEHYDKAVDRAQRRYLTAVRELGLARRLRMPKREADAQAARLRVVDGGKPAVLMIEKPKEAA
ncbi:MAG: hypothetical protein JWN14_609 [Chthonomonadales bacterium]|nr:hypothetical protein [Chthonomonadales bacterium]